jgi:hypothetical protein
MTDNLLLRAAVFYARRFKWPVFPLRPHTKEPLTEHGFKDASLDLARIVSWWEDCPTANIGVPTGIIFWVLDVDPRNGGDDSLWGLVGKNEALATTFQQMTGGGGRQYFYVMPDQMKIGCHNGLWPGIDVKGEGGYVVVPPSIHPSGVEYAWDGLDRIDRQTMNPANPWLIRELLAATTNGHRSEPFSLPPKIKKGVQHTTLFKMGASMRRKGCEEAEIAAALWEVNQNRCEEPGPRANIDKLAESIVRQYPVGGPPKSPPPPLPPPPPPPPQKKPTKSLAIYDANYPDPEPIVDSILFPGLTILGGRPKVGKSWLALQLALALISTEKLCGYLEVRKPCRCRYVSLEDRDWQVRARLRKLTPRQAFLDKLDFYFELAPLLQGGLEHLDKSIVDDPVDVLIIDSLLAAVKQATRKNLDIMQADYNVVAMLRDLAAKRSVALVLIAHTRKAAGDFLDLIQGTSGTTAAADAVWVLQRTPDGAATLSVTGREVETNVFGLKRENGLPEWIMTGEGEAISQSEARNDVVGLLSDSGPMKPSNIAQRLHKNISGVHRLLAGLTSSGLVVRTGYGTYQIPKLGQQNLEEEEN